MLVPGTNLLTLRIFGDPTYQVTGVGYKAPHYLDDYSVIEGRQQKFLLLVLCGIFGFVGVYYFLLFLSIRKKVRFTIYGSASIRSCFAYTRL